MRVLFTPEARRQYLAALTYISKDKPSAASMFHQKAGKSLSRLKDQPESGMHLPEFPDLLCREVIVSPYRFFYRVNDQNVWIVAVWHGAQLPEEPNRRDRDRPGNRG
jgi:toxin ParE1/3/4